MAARQRLTIFSDEWNARYYRGRDPKGPEMKSSTWHLEDLKSNPDVVRGLSEAILQWIQRGQARVHQYGATRAVIARSFASYTFRLTKKFEDELNRIFYLKMAENLGVKVYSLAERRERARTAAAARS